MPYPIQSHVEITSIPPGGRPVRQGGERLEAGVARWLTRVSRGAARLTGRATEPKERRHAAPRRTASWLSPLHLTSNWAWRVAGLFLLLPSAVLLVKPGMPPSVRLVALVGCLAGIGIVARRRWAPAIRRFGLLIPPLAALNLVGMNHLSEGQALQTWELVLWYSAGLLWIGHTQKKSSLVVAPFFVATFIMTVPTPWTTEVYFTAWMTVSVTTALAYLVAADQVRSRETYERLKKGVRHMAAVAQTGKVSPRQHPSVIHEATAANALELGFSGAGVASVSSVTRRWDWRSWTGPELSASARQRLTPVLLEVSERGLPHRIEHEQRELLTLPLLHTDDVLYVLVADSEYAVDLEQQEALELLAGQTTRNLEIVRMAFYDELTGLANRALFKDRLTGHLAQIRHDRDHSFLLLYLDVDRFKAINDLYGHDVGDHFLIELASRIRHCLREIDHISRVGRETSSRLGGDEFAVLVPGIDNAEDARRVAERLHDSLSEPFSVGGREVTTCPSIGAVLSDPRYTDPWEMMRDADTAMYRSKRSASLRWAIFDSAMRTSVDRGFELERSIADAVAREEVSLRFQPIATAHTVTPVGFEALLRWRHPTLGNIPASDFIPLAETTGHIGELTHWVLDQVMMELAKWNEQWQGPDPLHVTLNLSRMQIGDERLLDHLRSALEESTVAPEQLVIEITEGMALLDPAQTREFLGELRSLGIRLALDDFGTGYSSLSCLHEFPVDLLKVDRQFVVAAQTDERALRAIDGVVRMAHTMGLQVVAEGIEEPAQHELMKRVGCDLMQGFLISPPVRAILATEWLDAHDAGRALTPRGERAASADPPAPALASRR